MFACSPDEELSTEELKIEINRLKEEINQIIANSTGETSADCRTKYIAGGNSCGPILVYGIKNIDTVYLEDLFNQLSERKTELFELEGGPVCMLLFPSKDSLINGICKPCFETDDGFRCD